VTYSRFALLALLTVTPSARGAEPVTFEKDVKPVLRRHCITCHNPERPRGDLDLSTRAAILAGGTSGKAAVSGKPDESPLYLLAAHVDAPKMPPNKPKIPEKDLDVVKKWIEGGLVETGTTTSAVEPKAGGLTPAISLARPSAIAALAASPKVPLLALPGQKQVLIYDLAAAKFLGGLAFPEGEVHALRFSTDGKLLLAGGGIGGQSGLVVGFDVSSWKRAFTVGDETDAVMACDLSPDNSRVVLGGPTRAVKIYTVADGKLLHTFRKPTDWVTAVGFSPDGLLVAAGDRFGTLFLWETDSGKEYATLRSHSKGITGLSWRADGNALVTASDDGTVRFWNAHTAAEENHWTAHAGGALDVQFHASGKIATAGRDGRVRLWDGTGKSLAEFGPAGDHVLKVNFAHDAASLLAGDWSGDVKRWPIDGSAQSTIARPTRPQSAVRVVLPAKPAAPVATPTTAKAEVPNSNRALAAQAAAAALAQLKFALALEPDNAELAKAVAVAEAAVRSLAPEGSR
jgi:WD40 repeat protein